MELRKKDTKISRTICQFSETPKPDGCWDEELNMYNPDKVEEWKVGIDSGIYLPQLYANINGGIPEDYYEAKLKFYYFESILSWPVKRYFKENKGILLKCRPANKKRDTYYYLSTDGEDYVLEGVRQFKKINAAIEKARDCKFLSYNKQVTEKKFKAALKAFQKANMPSKVKIGIELERLAEELNEMNKLELKYSSKKKKKN